MVPTTMSTTTGGADALADKTMYSELTDTQQDIVDFIVENPGASNIEVAAEAECTDAYVSIIRSKYPDIIEEREHVVNNQHDTVERGNVKVEGTIDLSDDDTYPKPQTVKERPVKGSPDDGKARIDDFLPAATCARLERIAEDVAPDWLDRRATVEETIRALAQGYHLPDDETTI